MADLRTAAQQALEALEETQRHRAYTQGIPDAITALKAALEKPEQEPVAYIHRQGNHWEVSERFLSDDEKARGWTEEPLYTHPPRREWRGLTEEEIIEAVRESDLDWHRGWTLEAGESNRYTKLACTLDGVLKEKNHG